MIQKINTRHTGSSNASLRQVATDGPEPWGQWSGRKHYSLEVVQHPLRARMCGFGDKDRRPLAPAAVAKMIVRQEDNALVDVDDVDCSFFLVTVDLWSADGSQEMNLVLHPSSTDRYIPTHTTKPMKRRGGSTTNPPQRTEHHSPVNLQSTPSMSHYSSRSGDTQPRVSTPLLQTPATPYLNQGYSFPPQHSLPDGMSFQHTGPYGPTPAEAPPTWGYPPQASVPDRNTTYPPPPITTRHSFDRNSSPLNSAGVNGRTPASGEVWQQGEIIPFRPWSADTPYSPLASSQHNTFSSSDVEPSLRSMTPHHPPQTTRENSSWSHTPMPSTIEVPPHQGRFPQEFSSSPPNSQYEGNIYASASYAQHPPQAPYYPPPYTPGARNITPPPSSSSLAPIPRHTYTRTLVGPLSANACRLLDEHRKPGIFFLFQDLSVRTEGTFRLRLRLMNIGAPPAPEAGALRVHTDVSPVLAQTFTEPFTVYSAKRFPGVPDTTALSIALGNQGQKLPLRNRHGSSKQGRRRRGDSDESDEDST